MDWYVFAYVVSALLLSILLTALCGYTYSRWYRWTRSQHVLCYAFFLFVLTIEYGVALPLFMTSIVTRELFGIIYGSSGILKSAVLVYMTFFAED
ncbi:MAG: hypothetical protein ACTSXJ_09120 [Candidatus Baldrarchaeia archaeon]